MIFLLSFIIMNLPGEVIFFRPWFLPSKTRSTKTDTDFSTNVESLKHNVCGHGIGNFSCGLNPKPAMYGVFTYTWLFLW